MPKRFAELPRCGQLFVAAVIGLGGLAFFRSAVALVLQPVDSQWVVVAAALLAACVGDIATAESPSEALEATAHCLRQLTPAAVYARFVYDRGADVLTCLNAVGDKQRLLDGLNIRLGERVSGWVAANGRTAVNSDASLDLAQIAGFSTPPLRSTISAPLSKGDVLLGVLTAYSNREEAFNDGHRYTFEYLAAAFVARIALLQSITSSNLLSFRSNKK